MTNFGSHQLLFYLRKFNQREFSIEQKHEKRWMIPKNERVFLKERASELIGFSLFSTHRRKVPFFKASINIPKSCILFFLMLWIRRKFIIQPMSVWPSSPACLCPSGCLEADWFKVTSRIEIKIHIFFLFYCSSLHWKL